MSEKAIKTLPGLVFDFGKHAKHTLFVHIFFVLKKIYRDRSFRASGLVCAFLSSKSCLVSVRVAYSVPEMNELAVQTRHLAVEFYLDRIPPVRVAENPVKK